MLPLKVLSNFGELKTSRSPDESLNLVLETLLTLSEVITPVEKSNANVQRLGSRSFNSSSISCNVSKSYIGIGTTILDI